MGNWKICPLSREDDECLEKLIFYSLSNVPPEKRKSLFNILTVKRRFPSRGEKPKWKSHIFFFAVLFCSLSNSIMKLQHYRRNYFSRARNDPFDVRRKKCRNLLWKSVFVLPDFFTPPHNILQLSTRWETRANNFFSSPRQLQRGAKSLMPWLQLLCGGKNPRTMKIF